MKNLASIFFVTQTEYPKLQAVFPNDFPFAYTEFVARIEEGIKRMPKGFSVMKIEAKVEEFLAWCAKSNIKPEGKSRALYASFLAHKHSLSG